MNYETMDWDAEARRVARAFGVEGEYHFEFEDKLGEIDFGKYRHLCRSDGLKNIPYPERGGVIFFCRYGEGLGKLYCFECGYAERQLGIWIDWDGNWSVEGEALERVTDLIPLLAKAAFHLGLLTPEIEAALGASVTAHEKLEWKLEHETCSQNNGQDGLYTGGNEDYYEL